jgi:hypothetical protein
MSLNVWTKKSGYNFGEYPDQIAVDIPLPVSIVTGISFTIIAGELPPGLYIENGSIKGNPNIVASDTTFSFCIRAFDGTYLSDRTFDIIITGSNPPSFVIDEVNLDIGPAYQYFAIDNTYINYQLQSININIALNKQITYFISSGALPPGLTLSKTGLIYGTISVLKSSDPDNASSNFNFTVSITDGVLVTTHQYAIYVVGPEYLTADNTNFKNGNHLFTADVTPLRPIQWITSSNLGSYKANNFITIPLELIDPSNVFFTIDDVANLPSGLSFNDADGVISGYVPVQSQFDAEYTFTITATRYDQDNNENLSESKTFTMLLIGEGNDLINWKTSIKREAILTAQLGYSNDHGLPQSDQLLYITIVDGGEGYTAPLDVVIVATNGGQNALASCSVSNGSINNVIITNPGYGYITAPNVIIAEDIGFINVGEPSILSVTAYSSYEDSQLVYSLIDGELPVGLTLAQDGEIIGKITQSVGDSLSFYNGQTIFDGGTTSFRNNSFDRTYIFTVKVEDQYSSSTKSFSLYVNHDTFITYSNIYTRPYLPKDHREVWKEFINNSNIFTYDSLYRPYDINFGLQDTLTLLIYAGIETSNIDTFYKSIDNNKKKRLLFGNLKTAVGIDYNSRTPVYEVIYLEMQDPSELNGNYIHGQLNYNGVTYYPNSVSNWRKNILNLKFNGTNLHNDQSFLPLWMRSINLSTNQKPGFVLGVPLCYCKVGKSKDIVLNINNYIKNSDFNFNNIDFTVDRYIVDIVSPDTGNKYIVYNNERTII